MFKFSMMPAMNAPMIVTNYTASIMDDIILEPQS